MKHYFRKVAARIRGSRRLQILSAILLVSVCLGIYDRVTMSSRTIEVAVPDTIETPAIFERGVIKTTPLSAEEKELVRAEFPEYTSRHIEQTYLTLPEWYQVYSYNEFGDFLMAGGRQSDFPFLSSAVNFWSYYAIAADRSSDQEFNWLYNFVDWVIGFNLTFEYAVKAVYENTIGSITQTLAGSDTEADAFIAESWNSYAERMYQYTWYHYPYFTDIGGIWRDTPLFDKHFIRNIERKVAFTFSYAIKGTYARAWLLTAAQKDNRTLSIVHTTDKGALDAPGVEILKDLDNDNYLILTERYAGFKNSMLALIGRDVRFVEVMDHDVITLSYLSRAETEPFPYSGLVSLIDKRQLFFNAQGFLYRNVLQVPVADLPEALDAIKTSGSQFEMIYDF
ncbi:MAG: hypothetical protein KBD06_01525 [Candidatus Pacebacteria bacterium]|nr:hypothetical protein [Candidatus Paceibacterota bacterium]